MAGAKDRMLRTQAPIPAASPTIQGILSVEASEADKVYDALKSDQGVLAQFYAATATEYGLTMWETLLGLTAGPSDAIGDRRSQVIGKLIGYGSVTRDRVVAVANAFENGQVEVIEDFEHYKVILRFISVLGQPPNVGRMVDLVKAILPAHLVLEVQYTYNTWDQFDSRNAAHARDWNAYDALGVSWDNLPTTAALN